MTTAPPAARRDARASGLRYVSPDDPGITRRGSGTGFTYLGPGGRRVTGRETLARIRAIAIPPAWSDVWICVDPRGHIQATGRDARGRRQYRYHADFRSRRDDGKFARLVRFGERLPRIRRRVREDLRRPGLPREKVLATVLRLLEVTRLRVGNEEYARLNRSFGVSTLRDRHVRVAGATLRLRFRGKGGRTEERQVVDRRLAGIVRRCQELPGQELFQYLDEEGEARAISSEDVNAYLREAAGEEEFTAKDFRTWTATMLAFRALRDPDGVADGVLGERGKDTRRRNPIIDALRHTAEELNNTLAVTRSSYVHPGVLEAFEEAAAKLDASTPSPNGNAASRRPRAAAGARPDRRTELEVLRLLRRASRSGSRKPGAAARRSQVPERRVAGRSRRPAA